MTKMIGLAFAFALIISTSAQATPLAPLHQPDSMIKQIREACGTGMHMVNGTCVRTAAVATLPGVPLACAVWVAAASNNKRRLLVTAR